MPSAFPAIDCSGLSRFAVPGDGACGIYSLFLVIARSRAERQELRRHVAGVVARRWAVVARELPEYLFEGGKEGALRRIASASAYLSPEELGACACAFGLSVVVIARGARNEGKVIFKCGSGEVRYVFYENRHFEPMVEV